MIRICLVVLGLCVGTTATGQEIPGNFYISEEETAREVKEPDSPAAETNLQLRRRINTPAAPFKPARDPYGLAEAFEVRWDFSYFLITVQEELRFRLDAARARTLRIARAFSSLASEVEIRQRNLNAAALAAYLLSRDQATMNPLGGRSLTDAQMLAVQATMRQDMQAMDNALENYETLRTALNRSADHVVMLEKRGLSASPYNALAGEDRPTLPLNLVARAQTEAVLSERILDDVTLKAILESERLRTTGEARQSLASFAPPPPVELEAPAGYDYLTADPAAAAPQGTGTGLTMERPEQSAMIFPASVNAPVHALKGGVVVYAGPFRGYGVMVILEHEKGTFSVYSHLAAVHVTERESVDKGSLIGRAGTVPELGDSGVHVQVRKGKEPVSPAEWMGAEDVGRVLLGR